MNIFFLFVDNEKKANSQNITSASMEYKKEMIGSNAQMFERQSSNSGFIPPIAIIPGSSHHVSTNQQPHYTLMRPSIQNIVPLQATHIFHPNISSQQTRMQQFQSFNPFMNEIQPSQSNANSQHPFMNMTSGMRFVQGSLQGEQQMFPGMGSNLSSCLGSFNFLQKTGEIQQNSYIFMGSRTNYIGTNPIMSPWINNPLNCMNTSGLSDQDYQQEIHRNKDIWKPYQSIDEYDSPHETHAIQHTSGLDQRSQISQRIIHPNSGPSSTFIPLSNEIDNSQNEFIVDAEANVNKAEMQQLNEHMTENDTSSPNLILSLDDHIHDSDNELFIGDFFDETKNNEGKEKETEPTVFHEQIQEKCKDQTSKQRIFRTMHGRRKSTNITSKRHNKGLKRIKFETEACRNG